MNCSKLLTLALVLVFALGIANAQNVTHTSLLGVHEAESGYVGIVANITVTVQPGTGHVYIDTMPLTQIDTQASARLAKDVACEILKHNCTDLDFFYVIRGDYQFVGGPSAGSAMAAATMAALQGIELNSDVMITGTINPSGDIGQVGNILEKAEAAYKNGATIFLIPKGQSISYVEKTDERINIINYAKEHWGMKVIEISNMVEAYKYLSGYQISEPKISSADIASERYQELMKGLSTGLIADAETKLNETRTKLTGANISFVYADDINEILGKAETELSTAKSLYQDKKFYSAASVAVRSYIDDYYAFKKIDYYASGTNTTVELQLNQLKEDVTGFETMFLQNRQIDNVDDIEIFAVVIDRISESKDVMDSAEKSYKENDFNTAIYLTAYAEVRKNTAYNWLTTIDLIKGNQSLYFDHSKIKPLAQERVEQSKTSITYAQTVVSNSILEDAMAHQTKAEKALEDGKYVFALFEAAKARAEANLAMEARDLTNNTIQPKISSLEKDALSSIKDAEEQGLLPVLALSYLEFGRTMRDEEPIQSLIYMSYSKEMAKISKDLFVATTGVAGITAGPAEANRYYEYVVRIDYSQRILEAVLLVFSGALIGAIATISLNQRKKR